MNFTKLFSEFNAKKVLIVGDSMIDAYMWGQINRMSPEAPVPVVEVSKHENRLGGAANVALNLKALGATPILCSVVGDNFRGELFNKLMHEAALSTTGIMVEKDRKTTTKTRVIAANKHQLRIDEEDTHPITIEAELLLLVEELTQDIDVIILQDYNKGVLTPKVIEGVLAIANSKGIPTIVDPKKKNFSSYKNCTIFKPNLSEIKAGMQVDFDADNEAAIEQASNNLRELLQAQGVLLTLSERGICINTANTFKHTPAFACDIVDVSGAGDTVISVAALCLACRTDYVDLSVLSTLAGGIVCESVGVVPINKQQLLEQAQIRIK